MVGRYRRRYYYRADLAPQPFGLARAQVHARYGHLLSADRPAGRPACARLRCSAGRSPGGVHFVSARLFGPGKNKHNGHGIGRRRASPAASESTAPRMQRSDTHA